MTVESELELECAFWKSVQTFEGTSKSFGYFVQSVCVTLTPLPSSMTRHTLILSFIQTLDFYHYYLALDPSFVTLLTPDITDFGIL